VEFILPISRVPKIFKNQIETRGESNFPITLTYNTKETGDRRPEEA
jgi:hypothetical protein